MAVLISNTMIVNQVYGFTGSFVVDKSMNIKTVRVGEKTFKKMLKYSILRLLAWLQRTMLIAREHYNLKRKLIQGIKMNYDLNKSLINYYLCMKKRNLNEIQLHDPDCQPFSSDHVVGDSLYATSISNDTIGLFACVNHKGNHYDLVPLACLSDV
jgi:hypothetical protein